MAFSTTIQSTSKGTTDSRAYLDNYANAIVKVSGLQGIAGFLFDVPDQDSIQVDWDVTDHFTESNSFLNDHKVKKPVIVTLTGFVGELVSKPPEGLEGALQRISNRLETVEAYAGDSTPGGIQNEQRTIQQAQRTVSAINQTLDKAGSLVSFFSGSGPQETEQQKAYRTLVSLGNEVILSVQTPWEFFDDMTIISVGVIQGGETNQITDISVTLKQMRISDTKTTDFDQNQFPPRVDVQSAAGADQGNITGQGENSSVLFKAFGG